MVNRKVLEKLSNQELNNYLKPDSRYVAEAIEMAFEILKQRNVTFDTSETERIKSLIEKRREDQLKVGKERSEEKEYIETNNVDALPLQGLGLVCGFSVVFGMLSGSVLLAYNCIKLKKTSSAINVIAFGLLYSFGQILAFRYLLNDPEEIAEVHRGNPFYLFSILGGIIQYMIWKEVTPNKFVYRQASFLLPIIVAIISAAIIIWNYNELFSSFSPALRLLFM